MDVIYRYDPFAPLVPRQVTDTESALARLLGGNQRFGELVGRLQERTMGRGSDEPLVIPMCPVAWGLPLFKGQVLSQTPFAAILACSDARVPTETIFDQWFNDLFVLRLAGNVLGSECLGSLHYAIRNLADSLELVVVLGHSNCGAVQAAVSTYLSPTSFADIAYTYSLRSLIDQILIAVRGSAHALHEEGGSRIRTDARYPELLTAVVVYVNAAVSALELRRELSERKARQPVVFGVYDFHTLSVKAHPGAVGSATDLSKFLGPAPANPDELSAYARDVARAVLRMNE
ncbi:MAG: carbonic anhydrase [Planctomycetaceae bacterium]|jgi:carbonic anhydrase